MPERYIRIQIIWLLLLCTGGNIGKSAIVSWVGNNGDWNTATNWSTGALPGPSDDVVIDRPGDIIVTHSVGAHTVKSIQSEEAFTLSGGSLTVSNTLQANSSFTVAGGTLTRAALVQGINGQIVVSNNASFDGVTINGDLDVGRRNHGAALTVSNGLVLNGTLYVGNPTNTGWYASVHFSGSQTLSGTGTVVFGARADTCNVLRLTTAGTTLTIGAGITIAGHTGSVGYAPCWGAPLNIAVVNHGNIVAGLGGTILVYAQKLTNAGTLTASNNSGLLIETLHNTVSGTISLNGATLSLGGSWTNGGIINATNATLNLGGSFTLPDLGVINRVGGTINLTGTLDAGGGTLMLNATSGSWTINGGTLRNAAVTMASGTQVILGSGTFDGVTVNGDVDVGRRNHGAALTVLNGLVLNGTLYVGNPTNSGWYGSVHFNGSQTLGGNGTIVFGNRSDTCNTLRLATAGSTLTIGPGITIRGHSGAIGYAPCWGNPVNVTVVNQGTILAELSGGTVSLYAQKWTNQASLVVNSNASLYIDTLHNLAGGMVSVTGGTLGLGGSWTNGGTINATNATLNLGGTFTREQMGVLNRIGGTLNLTGTLDIGGGTLALDAATGSWTMNGGTLRNATVTTAEGTQFIFGSGTLDAVTVGDLDVGNLNNGAAVTVVNGLVLNGTMLIGNPTNHYYGTANFLGTQTFSGNGTVVFGNNSSMYNALRVLNNSTTLTIGPGITVRGNRGRVGYNPGWGGNFNHTVTNLGSISADVAAGQIDIMGQRFVNLGLLEAKNGAYLNVDNIFGNVQQVSLIAGSTLTLNGTYTNNLGLNLTSNAVLSLNGSWVNTGGINATGAVINLGGTFGLGDLGVINRIGGTINLTGMLDAGGGTVALNAATGSWVMNAGTLRNALLTVMDGAQLIFGTGTLDAVAVGDLDVGNATTAGSLTVVNGLTLNGTMLLGNPTNHFYGTVNFLGTQTLSGNGTVVLGNNSSLYNGLRVLNNNTALTIGPGITVRGNRGRIGYNPGWGGNFNHTVTNLGTISADVPGGQIDIMGQRFVNLGLLEAKNGGYLNVDNLFGNVEQVSLIAASTLTLNGTYTNNLALNLTSNAVLNLNGSWINTGAINATGATVNLGGSFALDVIGTINRVGGLINLTGTLDASGGTLALDATSGSWTMNGGTLRNALLTTAGGAQLVFGTGTLDAVTVGDLDIGNVNNVAALTVMNGLILNGTMRLGNPTNGNYGTVNFLGTQTLSGNGTVVFGHNVNMYNALRVLNNNTALTIGSGITVRGNRGRIGYNPGWGGNFNHTVTNLGTILADVAGGQIDIMGQRFINGGLLEAKNGGHLNVDNLFGNTEQVSLIAASTLTLNGTYTNNLGLTVVSNGVLNLNGTWVNIGGINVTGATVNLGGTFTLSDLGMLNRVAGAIYLTGTLNAGGGTLALDATTGSWVMNGGTLRNATLTTADGAQLIFGTGTFDGVTAGDLEVGDSTSVGSLTVMNGLVLNGAMRIGNPTNANYGTVNFLGTQTLSGNGMVLFGHNVNMYNALRVLNNNTALTIGNGITVRGNRGRIGYNPGWGGNFNLIVTNFGTISSDVAGGQLDIMGQQFVNLGLLEAKNSGTLAANAQVTVNSGDISLLSSGILDFNGPLEFDDVTPLVVPTGCVLRVSGGLLGQSSNLMDFVTAGTVTLDGSGTAGSPQLLEVMGRDLGSGAAGFTSNFVFGALTLANNTYVRLIDLADNSSGSGAEAIYVNSLVVPAGSTLNLNGLHLYARTGQVAGAVINTAATSFATDFTTHPAGQGIQFLTTPLNSPNAGYWNSSGGYAVLTDAIANQRGKMLLPVLSDTEPVGAFTATLKLRLGGSTCCTRGGLFSPADGLSFNFAALNDPAVTNPEAMGWINHDPEEGVTNGISVCIDTWDNLGGEAPNIDLKVDGKVVATAPFAGPYRNGGQSTNPVRDALGNPLPMFTSTNWAELSVSLNQCGGVTVIYKGVTIFDDVASGYVPRVGRFLLGGRTGGANEYHHIDDINISIQPVPSSSFVSALIPAVSTDVSPDSPVGFVIQERDAVDTNSIQLRLDGSVVPTVLTSEIVAGVRKHTVQHTPAGPFAAGSTHTVELTFSHTNGTSCAAKRSFVTSIIGPGTLFIEAEDFNFSDSDGVNPAQHIEFGAPDGSLLNKDATVGIDFQDDLSLNGAVDLYRSASTVEAAKGPVPNADQSRLRGSRLITADWVVAWTVAGEWLNYTRTFPDAKYNIYVRWGSGAVDGTAMAAELGEVISNPAQSNQVVRKIGEFRSPEPTGGWELFFTYSQLRDTNGAPLAVRLHGKRTLRFTVLPSNFDYNYLAFVPDPAAPILRPLAGVSPPDGVTTSNAYPRIDVLFTNRDAAVVTSTLRLIVNGTDVTSISSISNTAFGGVMSYQVPQPGYPVLSTVNVSASFTDDGPVPESQTNNWSFIAGGILITEQPADQTVPLGGDATFSVSAAGSPALSYQWLFNNAPIGGATNATFTVTNAQAANVGNYKVVVSNPGGAVTSAVAALTVIFPPPMVHISPPSTNVALGGMVTFCADVTGHGPFTYQWRQNGVTLTNETNVCLQITDVQLSHGGAYSVIVANNGGATLSDPALLVLDVRVVQGSDSVTNRLRLTNDSGIGSGTNSFAGRDLNEPRHSGKPGGKSIWYEWTPSVSGIARFETVGSTFDTLIAVYVQCSSNELVEVASDDDGGPNLTSFVQFNAAGGTTYLIAVDGFGGADGVYALTWNLTPADDPLAIILQPPQSLTVAPGATAQFEVQAVAGAGIVSPCEPATTSMGSLAYQWFRNGTAVPDATSSVLTIENVQQLDLGIYVVEVIQGSQTNRTPPASLQLNLTGEETQNVQAQNKFEDAAETQGIELGADQAPAPLQPRPPRAASGGGAIVRGYSGTQVFDTSGSTTEPGDEPICGVIGGASQWITFVCRETGALHLNTDGSSYNTVMAVFVRRPNNPAVLDMVDCDNNGGLDGRDSSLSVPVEGGETNFVMVDGVNGQTGTLLLNYSLVTPCVVTAPAINGNGNFQLRISGRAGMKLTVQGSTDMITWTDLGTLTLPTATFDYVDPSGAGSGHKFYRALMLP